MDAPHEQTQVVVVGQVVCGGDEMRREEFAAPSRFGDPVYNPETGTWDSAPPSDTDPTRLDATYAWTLCLIGFVSVVPWCLALRYYKSLNPSARRAALCSNVLLLAVVIVAIVLLAQKLNL